jgi:hypothetical protein
MISYDKFPIHSHASLKCTVIWLFTRTIDFSSIFNLSNGRFAVI